MAEFYVRENKIFMDDGTVSLHIADLRPELTETQKIKIGDALKKEGAKYDGLFSLLSAADSHLYDARRALEDAFEHIILENEE